jgi:hypothetical protein
MSMVLCKLRSILLAATATLAALEPAFGQVSVLTYHNDNGRSGLNPFETILTPGNVNSSKFGKAFLPLRTAVWTRNRSTFRA